MKSKCSKQCKNLGILWCGTKAIQQCNCMKKCVAENGLSHKCCSLSIVTTSLSVIDVPFLKHAQCQLKCCGKDNSGGIYEMIPHCACEAHDYFSLSTCTSGRTDDTYW